MATKTHYIRTTISGGGSDAIDGVDGAILNDGDIGDVYTIANYEYTYILDADSGLDEDYPYTIEPDTNAGNRRWILQTALLDHRYYTESEIDGMLITTFSGLSDTPSTYENYKYLRSTADGTEWATVSGGEGMDHAVLANLDYASSGHTGFQPAGDYLTDTEFSTYSGTLQTDIDTKSDTGHLHDDRYYTEDEVDTVSGSLNDKINDLDYYTTNEVDTISGSLSDEIDSDISSHSSSGDHDGRYYTEGEVDALTWTESDIIDLDKYTQAEVDTISGSLSSEIDSDISTHGSSSDHDGRYYTETELNAGQLDNRYYTEGEVDTISGSLSTEIDSDITTHALSSDHDGRYYTEAEITTISGNIIEYVDDQTAADIIYDGTETIEHILDDTINGGIIHSITVSNDRGGVTIDWSAGKIWDVDNAQAVSTVSGTGAATNNNSNYLIWASGSTLTLGTTRANIANCEVPIAHCTCQDGVVYMVHEDPVLDQRESAMADAMAGIVQTIVTTGLIISENDDAINALDVTLSAGVFYHKGSSRHEVSEITSSGTLMVRHFHTGGVWDSDTNAEIDTTQYDDGDNLAAHGSKWYKSLFIAGENEIHWVYPRVQYNNIAAALIAPLPTVPPGLGLFPSSTALVYQGGAAAFPTAGSNNWIDVRPTLTPTAEAAISDHGNLSGLSGDDHSQYHTDARGDARYYTETELDNGQLDSRYYTETESDGNLVTFSGTIDHDTILNTHDLTTDIDHNQLTNYAVGQHRTINDSGLGATDLWSAEKIDSEANTLSGTLQTNIDEKIEEVVDDTTPQLGGDLDTNNKNISWNPVPGSDQEASGNIATMQVDANATGFGAALHIDTDGNFIEADANSADTMPCQALALETGTGSKKILLRGFVRDDAWDWTVGGSIYVSVTTGAITQAAPEGTGDQAQIIGFATHADRIFFNPSYIMLEVL